MYVIIFYGGSDLCDCCLEEWLLVVSPFLFSFSLCSSSFRTRLCCSTSIWCTMRPDPFSLRCCRRRRKCAARSASSTNDIMVGGRLWPYIMALVLSRHSIRRFWRARIEEGSFSLFSMFSIPQRARFGWGSRGSCWPRRWTICFFSFSMHPLVSLDRLIASESLDGLNRGVNVEGGFELFGKAGGDNDILRGRKIPTILPGDSFLSASHNVSPLLPSAFLPPPLAMEWASGFLSKYTFKLFTLSKSLLNVTRRRWRGRTPSSSAISPLFSWFIALCFFP